MNTTGKSSEKSASNRKKAIKWRSMAALLLMYLIVFMDWQWGWGIFFLLWTIPDIISGTTYFMELVRRDEEPLLYWFIVMSSLWMAIYSFSVLLL